MLDLDLSVEAPALRGALLLGNGGSAADPAQPDRENNVERVAVGAMPAGEMVIRVAAHNVPEELSPMSYALVVQGNFRWARRQAPRPAARLAPRSGDNGAVLLRTQCTRVPA